MPWTPNTSQLASNSGCQNGVQSQHTTIQNSRDSVHPILMGAGLGAQYPKNAHLPRGYRMTQIAAAISSKREIGARLLYYGAPLIHCFLLRICGAFVSVHRSCAPRLELPSPFPSLSFSTTTTHSGYGAYGQQKERKRTGKEKQWMSSSFFIHFGWGFVLQWLPRHITGHDDVADTVPLDKRLSLFPIAALP